MAPSRLVAHRQLEILVEFAEENKAVALNRHTSQFGNHGARKAWEEVAVMLNSVDEGIKKTPEKWKRYWHLLKCRTKAKAADVRRRRSGTEGESRKIIPLTDLERRIVWVIGEAAVARTPVRIIKKAPKRAMAKTIPIREAPVVERDKEKERDGRIPNWAYALEQRRIAVEERLAAAVASIAATHDGILKSLQQIAASQAQLVNLQDPLHPRHSPN